MAVSPLDWPIVARPLTEARGTGNGASVKHRRRAQQKLCYAPAAPSLDWTRRLKKLRFNDFFRLFLNRPETIPTLDCAHNGKGRKPVGMPDRSLGMWKLVAKFWADQSGATAIEYGLIAAGISIVIVVVVNGMGTALNGKYSSISTSLK
jgi:pilus assembly protein Flp/PilA